MFKLGLDGEAHRVEREGNERESVAALLAGGREEEREGEVDV